jgi:hypothetical protein
MEAKEGVTPKSNKKQSWTKRVVNGDVTQELEVKQVSNGFIVCIRKYGNKNGKWTDDTQEYISNKNPLEDEDPEETFSDQLDDLLDDLAEQDGMINVK